MFDNDFSFLNLGRTTEIGANSYLLQFGDHSLVLDAGTHPKSMGHKTLPNFRMIEEAGRSPDAIIITHPHLDHIGGLPVLQRLYPDCPVFMTAATAQLGEALLHNSSNVMKSQSLEFDIEEYPLFEHSEIEAAAKQWITVPYEREFFPFPDLGLTLLNAGHVLGSAGVLLTHPKGSVFYTGDVQFSPQSLIDGAKFQSLSDVDTLIMETTRGNFEQDPTFSREKEELRLATAIQDTLSGGGAVLIPVFAIGKTQELLTMLHCFKKDGLIPNDTPIAIGGLSTKMTSIYDKHPIGKKECFQKFRILKDMELKLSPKRSSSPITSQPGSIFALSSGMMTEHTVSNRFAQEFLNNPANSLLFVGYADPDSPAGKIQTTPSGKPVTLDKTSSPVDLDCRVERFDFSGHATREQLVTFAKQLSPKKILLIHGDAPSVEWFQSHLPNELPEAAIIAPPSGQEFPLFTPPSDDD